MKRPRIAVLMAGTICLVSVYACAGSAGGESAAPAPRAGAGMDFDSLYRARIDSARTRYTEADVRFMTGMMHHHAQAIEVANLVPTRAQDASIQTLARRIISAQQDEIGIMQQWLRDRGQPVPDMHGGHHGAVQMPGMLTAEQVEALRSARGPAFDRLFLELMIQHHRGAVRMVRDLFATDGAGQDEEVFRFASDVQVDQSTEVARMERMLAALPAAQ